jgi:hypothetical protein
MTENEIARLALDSEKHLKNGIKRIIDGTLEMEEPPGGSW